MNNDSPKDVVQRQLDAFNARDQDAIMAVYAGGIPIQLLFRAAVSVLMNQTDAGPWGLCSCWPGAMVWVLSLALSEPPDSPEKATKEPRACSSRQLSQQPSACERPLRWLYDRRHSSCAWAFELFHPKRI
jgi:hypothetical protein